MHDETTLELLVSSRQLPQLLLYPTPTFFVPSSAKFLMDPLPAHYR